VSVARVVELAMKSERALGHNTSEWIQNSIRRIDTIQVFGDFGAEKAPA